MWRQLGARRICLPGFRNCLIRLDASYRIFVNEGPACVITSTPPWGPTRCDDSMLRGPHKSAQDKRAFVCEEIHDFCTQGYWAVMPYSAVRHWKKLRISPLGVVPQRDRRPRLIVDYSFSAVNSDTVNLAPADAMQFGRALQRVLSKIVHADPRYGPVQLSNKIDIADGFYRVWLQWADIPKLRVDLPTSLGQPPLVAFLLVLPMGWVESPPYFTTLTETACDLANNSLCTHAGAREHSTAHRLDPFHKPRHRIVPLRTRTRRRPPDLPHGQRQGRPPHRSGRRLCRRFFVDGPDASPATTRSPGLSSRY